MRPFFILLLVILGTLRLSAQTAEISSTAFQAMDGKSNKMLASPKNVKASDGTRAYEVRVSWEPSKGAVAYYVYKAAQPHPSPKVTIASNVSKSTWRSDYQVAPGVLYYYAVVAVDAFGNRSEPSTEDSGFIPWAPLIATPITFPNLEEMPGNTLVNFAWTPCATASRYEIQFATNLGDWTTTNGFNESIRTMRQVSVGTELSLAWDLFASDSIYWSVRAIGEAGNGFFSTPVKTIRSRDDLMATPGLDNQFAYAIRDANLDVRNMLNFTASNNTDKEIADAFCLLFLSKDEQYQRNDLLLHQALIPTLVPYSNQSITIIPPSFNKLDGYNNLIIVPLIENNLVLEQAAVIKINQ